MCQQTHLRFNLNLRETFSKSTSLIMMKTQDKSAAMEIFEVLGTLSHVHCQSVLPDGAFCRVLQRSFSQSVISEKH